MSNEVAETVTEVATAVAATAVPAQKAVSTATKLFFKSVGKVKRFSPEILMVVGVTGVITAGVLACKATLKLDDVVTKAEDDIVDVKNRRSENAFETEVDFNKALTKVYINRGFQVAKLYTPAISVGLVGVGCLLGAHGIMSKRNVAMAAAYSAVESSFAEYRGRVVNEVGEDKEKELRYGIVETEVPVYDESGKQTGTKKLSDVTMGNGGYSGYARIFDETNEMWSNIPGQNQFFLTNQQNWLNDRLDARGYVFLNDVYKCLGIPVTPAGQVVGWLASNHEDSKDGQIDFGLFEIEKQAKRDFVNGFEKAVILDFNVDGDIHQKI